MKMFAITAPGLEDVCAAELKELIGVEPQVDVGKVFFNGSVEAIYTVNFSSRLINRLFIQVLREKGVSKLEDVYRLMKSVDYEDLIPPDKTFAIKSERVGKHDFTSLDVSRVAGQAVIDSYIESKGLKLRVNLDEPDVEIWVFLRYDELIVGINTTGEGLHKRRYRVYSHPAALKTTIAAGMLRIGEYKGQPLLDPLCGGGTIPVEAAHLARRIPIVVFRRDYLFRNLKLYDPALETNIAEKLIQTSRRDIYEIYCMDISSKHLRGALENARSALVDDTIKFLLGDATRKESYKGINASLVVTNPPYGIRSHRIEKIGEFYESFAKVLADVFPGARLVLITASVKQFEQAAEKVGLEIEHQRTVMHGGLTTRIYKVKL
ncbi:MAG: tRNA (guanine(6)-N2)-methyltransferase [Desulfurococcaceae archaeon]